MTRERAFRTAFLLAQLWRDHSKVLVIRDRSKRAVTPRRLSVPRCS